ncbi:zinc finger (C3HC4 type RING finger) protein, putative [Eimeria maxima]|uniref:Zinc finger (C3HC4 type RING finger) protein, putative n=1 Tax=Eimeria maxima TaxID=5804 RepID=U6M5Q4_EIMMA|nr:zinc finger (C3HC4 type RING finger) protein, putative [Eimeria maxima]CDJ57789.1 zinc finger (C3HC4 type RING finger) protein, putative [Eimeria maxima]
MTSTGTGSAAAAEVGRSSSSTAAAAGETAARGAGGGGGTATGGAAVGDEAATIPSGFLGTLVPVRRTFIEEVPEDLRCPICYDGAANCSTRCGHSFCLHCLYSHITTRIIHQQSTACPLCRSANAGLGISTVSGEKSARARALRVRCLGFEGGCQVEGPLAEVEQHEATCPTVLIFCRFRDVGCSTPVLRKEVCTATYVWSLAAARDVVDVAEGAMSATRRSGWLKAGLRLRGYRNMQKFVSCRHVSLGCGLRVRKQYRERHAECCAFKILHELKLKRRVQQQQQQQQGASLAGRSSAPLSERTADGAETAPAGAAAERPSATATGVQGDSSSAASAATQATAGVPEVVEEAPAPEEAAEEVAAAAESKMSDCADLCLALQWSSPQALPNELLLLRLQEFLPNVTAITEGRFPGEFHVVLKQQVHTLPTAAGADASVSVAVVAVAPLLRMLRTSGPTAVLLLLLGWLVPLLAVRSIGMAGDPNMSSNLSGLGLLYKGLTTLQSP